MASTSPHTCWICNGSVARVPPIRQRLELLDELDYRVDDGFPLIARPDMTGTAATLTTVQPAWVSRE